MFVNNINTFYKQIIKYLGIIITFGIGGNTFWCTKNKIKSFVAAFSADFSDFEFPMPV